MENPWPSQPTSTASNLCSKACLLSGVIGIYIYIYILYIFVWYLICWEKNVYIYHNKYLYIYIYTRMYHISKWYMFHTFHFFHSDATSLILQVNSWAQVVLVNNESWGENISTQTKRCLYKGKTAFLGSLFWSGYPIHVPPKHVSSLPTSCSAFSSLRKTYGRKVFMEGKTRQLQHIKERMQLLFDGFNMLQYDNMVQYGSKSSWFLVLSNWIGLSAFDVNFCLHIVTSLQLWCLFLSRTESHLIDDLFMTSFTACCKWSPWMFKVFDRVTKKRRSPDLLLKQNNAHPISWTIKKATSVWAPLPCRKWWPPEMACETVKLSTLWGFFLGLGSLGECFCWRVVHLTGPLSLHQLPPQNWTILKSACRTFHSPSRCISSRSEQKKVGHETAQPTARCRNEPTGPWAIQTTCFGWCLKIREHLQEFPHTNDYTFGMKQIISKILKMIFCRLSKFETYGQFYQRLLPSQDATGFGFESCWLCWLLGACWKAFFSWQPREERCKVEVDLVDPHRSRRTSWAFWNFKDAIIQVAWSRNQNAKMIQDAKDIKRCSNIWHSLYRNESGDHPSSMP